MSNPLPRFWFGPPPELLPGEQWLAHHPANRTQGLRAVGGGLHLSTHRILFRPNTMDSMLGGAAWSADLAEVEGAGIEPPRYALGELFSGGLRERLRVDLRGGRGERFVISAPSERAAEIRAALAKAGGASPT